MSRLVAIAAAAALLSGCGTKACKDNTIFVSFSGADGAEQILVDVTVGGSTKESTVQYAKGSGTLEVDFSPYPAGQSVEVRLTALQAGTPIATAAQSTSLGGRCATLSLSLVAGTSDDLAVDDLGPSDLAGADLTPPPPDMTSCALAANADCWVDPVNGADDAMHGGQAGSCAFKTIGYALAHSTRIINLTPATYADAMLPTLPMTLSGQQGFDCDPLATGTRGILSSTSTGGPGLISIAGTNNVVRNCVLDAMNSSGANCMVVNSSSSTPHTILNTEFRNCFNNGIITQNTGSNINISNSTFKNNARGVWWFVANPVGVMSNNTFSNNSFFDIDCMDTATSVTGTGNKNGATTPTCHTCTHCPFP